MLLDAQTLLSDDQDVSQVVGNYLSDHSFDLGAVATDDLGNTPPHDVGPAEVELHVQMTEGLDSAGGTSTIQFQLVIADDEALTSNLTILQQTAAIAEAVAVAGYRARLGCCLPGGTSDKRYVGVRYVIAGETSTTGKVTAALGITRQSAGLV